MLSKEKKTALCSVLIFLAVIFAFVLLQSYSFARWNDIEVLSSVIYLLFLFSPLIACVAARFVTGERFRDGILLPKFVGHGKVYLLAIFIPVLTGITGGILLALYLHAGFTFKVEGGWRAVLLSLLLASDRAYYATFITAGEELGWRALLYDKLEILLGTNASVILGGIIWGVWHFPALYYMGLNFGTDYPGFPFLGILLMCVATVFIGAALQLVRKMGDSVIPACVAHGLIDSVTNVFMIMFLSEELVADQSFAMGVFGFVLSSVIVGLPCWIVLTRKYGGSVELVH